MAIAGSWDSTTSRVQRLIPGRMDSMNSRNTAGNGGPPLNAAVRLSNEHNRLNRLYAALMRDLRPSSRHIAYASFVRLRDTLESHFDVEDQVHFPIVEKLRPEFASLILSLRDDHSRYRNKFIQISQIISVGEINEGRRLLGTLAEDLMGHERTEEDLLARIMNSPT